MCWGRCWRGGDSLRIGVRSCGLRVRANRKTRPLRARTFAGIGEEPDRQGRCAAATGRAFATARQADGVRPVSRSKKRVKYHVDVFAAVERVEIDGETVYEGGKYTV